GGVIVSALRSEYQAAAAREAELRGRVNRLTGSVLDLRGRSIQYNILQRDVATNRQLYDALLQRYKEVWVAGGVEANNISLVDRAKRPTSPFKPDVPLNLLIGALLGVAGGAGASLGLEFMTNKVRTLEDVENKLGIPPLGVIPKIEKGTTLGDLLENPRSQLSEAYASLRSAIQFATAAGAPSTLLVTS